MHGFEGPVQISDGGYRAHQATRDFINGAAKVGYPFVHDLCDFSSSNAVAPFLRYSSPDGKRQDAAHCYVHPLLRDGKHPNLHVVVETQVVRVLFDDRHDSKRATGVEIVPNPKFHQTPVLPLPPDCAANQSQTVRARKLVVLSAGAVGSPGILERSGVADKDVLAKAGIPLVADVPGVGASFEDHHLVFCKPAPPLPPSPLLLQNKPTTHSLPPHTPGPYKTSLPPSQTNDAIVSGRIDRTTAIAECQRRLGWNFVDAAVKARPTPQDLTTFPPSLLDAWNRDFAPHPSRPLIFFTMVQTLLGDLTYSSVPPGQYVSPAIYTAYPYSRGHVHVTGPSLSSDPLDFHLGIFTDPGDVDLHTQVWAYKKQRELMRRTAFYRGEVAALHPRFPPGSKAACVEMDVDQEYDPERMVERDIEYTPEDDAAIERCLRETVKTCYHSLGTVRMAPPEELGGVDASLSVHGVRGVKVVDLSVVPRNVGANTCNTALMIGEKGADVIMRELGIVRG